MDDPNAEFFEEDMPRRGSKEFNEARARNESAKADLNELDFKVKSRQYLSRDAFIQASATAIATFAQTCRTLPDALERKGIPPSVCEQVMQTIDGALTELADELSKFTKAN